MIQLISPLIHPTIWLPYYIERSPFRSCVPLNSMCVALPLSLADEPQSVNCSGRQLASLRCFLRHKPDDTSDPSLTISVPQQHFRFHDIMTLHLHFHRISVNYFDRNQSWRQACTCNKNWNLHCHSPAAAPDHWTNNHWNVTVVDPALLVMMQKNKNKMLRRNVLYIFKSRVPGKFTDFGKHSQIHVPLRNADTALTSD